MTFYDLLSSGYEFIQIPLIQRDYVQGRATTDIQKEDRAAFVHTLLDATLPGSPTCHLDFIYGSCDKASDSQLHRAFLPLDGQQRLTTLFLLHWMLLRMADANEQEDPKRWSLLKKFSYKTRIGSETFCRKLLENKIIIENKDALAAALKYQGWYGNDMKCDPTVQAMLEMIGAIEDALREDKYAGKITLMKENLFLKPCITFNLLDLDEYHLTDGLYVKMNARGKELTVFENWKAEFIEFLSAKDKEWGKDYKERFKDSIEHDWHDLFWTDVYKEYEQSQQSEQSNKKRYPRIDEHFICFFLNMHRLYYFLLKGTSCKVEDYKMGTKSQQDEVFSCISGGYPIYLDMLFNGLDWLHKVHSGQGLDSFFSSVFQNSDPARWTDRVSLFGDGNQELNLFRRFVSQPKASFEGSHVLLYAIVKYGIATGIQSSDEKFLEYVRNCRNLLESKSYFDHGDLVMQSQVRVTDMAEYDAAFNEFMAGSTSESSIRKKIEDLPFTHGNTTCFEDIISRVERQELREDSVWDAIISFNSLKTNEKVRVLLSNGFRGVMVGDCGYGKRVFLGSDTSKNKTPVSHWDVVFRTKESQNIKEAVNSLIQRYCNGEALLDQIRTVRHPSEPLDYMLKYNDVLCAQVHWRGNNPDDAYFFFAMQNPWKDLDMIAIHSYSGNPLAAAYQICPMVCAVAKKVSFQGSKSFLREGHAAEKAGMRLTDKNEETVFEMTFQKMEWKITEGIGLIPQEMKCKYSIGEDMLLHSTEQEDLIEIAAHFMEDIYNYLHATNVVQ